MTMKRFLTLGEKLDSMPVEFNAGLVIVALAGHQTPTLVAEDVARAPEGDFSVFSAAL